MAIDVEWLDAAKEDLVSILDHIARDKPRAAGAYVSAIAEAGQRLTEFPESGPALDQYYRQLVVGSHIIIYRFDRDHSVVIISAVVHGRQDIARILTKLPR